MRAPGAFGVRNNEVMKSKRRKGRASSPLSAWRAVTVPPPGDAPPDSNSKVRQEEPVSWWHLKRDHKPELGIELRAIVEIAMAFHEALPKSPGRGSTIPRVDSAIVKPNGKATIAKPSQTKSGDFPARLLAPEVARGEPADVSANLYCLGAMLFEAVTGKPFESGQQVREELNRIRTRGRSKEVRSRESQLLMLAARTTFAEPAARGPDPRKFATHVVVTGAGQVASRQALAEWVGTALGEPVTELVEPSVKAETSPPPVVIHAPPVSIMPDNPAEPAPEAAAEAPPSDTASEPSSETEPADSAQLDAVADPGSSDEQADAPASREAPEEQLSTAKESPRRTPRRRFRRAGSSHALLAVLATALLMAIATSARFVHHSPRKQRGSDAIGQRELPARKATDTEQQNSNSAGTRLGEAHSDDALRPCPRPPNDGNGELAAPGLSEDAADKDTVVLKPASGTPRSPARRKSDLKVPDYGI